MAEEKPITPHNQDRALVSPKQSRIYSQISRDTLAQIKNIDLVSSSFTTKVDTLCRNLLCSAKQTPTPNLSSSPNSATSSSSAAAHSPATASATRPSTNPAESRSSKPIGG
ncbi:hypothetical protein V490_05265 [Pseudogymnoascus sp. VKM F-3557]|nr:hypothetical protein V490_05265 [Pseudogymnoascus sp. VKM F-3557]